MTTATSNITTLYTVQAGDTLSKLAQQFYGDASLYPLIANANSAGSNTILPIGARIKIPPVTASTDELSEVQVTVQPVDVPGMPGINVTTEGGLETVTVAGKPVTSWLKDWRVWALAGGIGLIWYLSRRKR